MEKSWPGFSQDAKNFALNYHYNFKELTSNTKGNDIINIYSWYCFLWEVNTAIITVPPAPISTPSYHAVDMRVK